MSSMCTTNVTYIRQCAEFMNQKFHEANLPLHFPQDFIYLSESFTEDFLSSNYYIYHNIHNLISELNNSWALIIVPICFCICLLMAYSVRTYFTSLISLISSEVLVMLALFIAPITVPWKAHRFYLGLLFFASFLTIHSYVFDKIQNKSSKNSKVPRVDSKENVNGKSNNQPKDDSVKKPNDVNGNETTESDIEDNTWLSIYLETALFIRKQHSLSHAEPKISKRRLLYLVVVGFLVDFAMFLIKEFIPQYIKPANQYFFTSLIGGLWVLLAMDFSYCIANVVCDFIGKPIPYVYRHRHPFLSASISEFWGIRWNPIVGKLLQDSFYKPARRMGLSRSICMVICFIGSAALHAYPQYLSTYNLKDTLMMGGFFICQGFLILIEHGFFSVLGLSKYFSEHIMIKGGGSYTGAQFQWLVELFTVATIVSSCYFTIDRHLTDMSYVEWGLFILFPICAVVGYAILTAHTIAIADTHINNNRIFVQIVASKVMGWLLTLAIVVVLLPLFCIPVLNAIGPMHPKSYIAGPVLRTIVKAMKIKFWEIRILRSYNNFEINVGRNILSSLI